MKIKSEHRAVIAIVISTVFFVVWYTFLMPKNPAPVATEQKIAATTPASAPTGTAEEKKVEQKPSPEANEITSKDPQINVPVKTWNVDNGIVEASFTNDGGVANKWMLKEYQSGVEKTSPLVNLAIESKDVIAPFTLKFADADFYFPENPRFELVSSNAEQAVFKWRSNEVEITKTISIPKNEYLSTVSIKISNLGNSPKSAVPSMLFGGEYLPPSSGGFLGIGSQPKVESATPVFYVNKSVERKMDVVKLVNKEVLQGETAWAGVESRYFLGAVIPKGQVGTSAEFGAKGREGKGAGTPVYGGMSLSKIIVPAGDSKTVEFSVYAGPKDIKLLKAVGVKLEDAIDYGWFTVIAIPILYLLRFFYNVIHNYGVAIIILTIFVKLLLHPINVKSLKSMKAMQMLQPRLKELQQKFKDDKQRLNQETMQLFKTHKVNPMGGCIPMLAQFPIYIALYKVLWNSIELYHAPFFWFYKDLSAPDPYYITPILLGLFMVAQQKLTPSASADPAQQKMMMIMPIMFTVFMLFLPAGLVVYILVNTVMSVTQQWMYNNGYGVMDIIKARFKKAEA